MLHIKFINIPLILWNVNFYENCFSFNFKILELKANGIKIKHEIFFDTIKARPKNMTDFCVQSEKYKINVRYFNDSWVGISLDETTLVGDIKDLLLLFGVKKDEVKIF